MADAAEKLWTVAEFLAWEQQQPEKWELVEGQPRMMTGGTGNHSRVKRNVVMALERALDGTPCEAFVDGPRLELEHLVAYPDAIVTCDPPSAQQQTIDAPKVLIEVLSPTTANFDRGAKWIAYQTIPSLLHYLIIAPDTPRVEMYTRRGDRWDYVVIQGLDETVALAGIGVDLTMADLYRRCFPEAEAG